MNDAQSCFLKKTVSKCINQQPLFTILIYIKQIIINIFSFPYFRLFNLIQFLFLVEAFPFFKYFLFYFKILFIIIFLILTQNNNYFVFSMSDKDNKE